MKRVSSICSPNLGQVFKILASVKLEGFIEFIKFINAYTHSERKNQVEFMKGILKITI